MKKIVSIIIALCLCVFSLSACSSNDPLKDAYNAYVSSLSSGETALSYTDWLDKIKNADSFVDELLDAYNAYAQVVGNDAISYDAWKSSFEKFSGAGASISVSTDGIVTVTLSNGDTEVFDLYKTYKVTALVAGTTPLEGVAVCVFYYDENSMRVEVAQGRTNSNGEIKFPFSPETGITYYAGLASDADDGLAVIPQGYDIDMGVSGILELPVTSTEFTSEKTATLNFKDMGSSFMNRANRVAHLYKRYYESGVSVDNNQADAFVTIPAGYYRYLSFNPLFNDTEENKLSATGKYRISILSENGDINMKQFIANEAYAVLDSYGIPAEWIKITGTAPSGATPEEQALYTGTNYIDIEITTLDVGKTFYFAFHSDTDTDILVSVERTGDARTVVYNASTPSAETTYDACQAPTFTKYRPVAVDGSEIIVFNETDGLYHVGSKDGALLLVQLKNAVNRVSDFSVFAILEELSKPETNALTPFKSTVYDQTNSAITITSYDYTSAMRTYVSMADANGYLHVDATMKEILKAYGANSMSAGETDDEYEWLLACFVGVSE